MMFRPMIHEYYQFAQNIARGAGEVTLKYFKGDFNVFTKSSASDPLTDADLASNDYLTSAIQENYPDHGIISEETDDLNPDAEFVWVLDPIDGTYNFSTSVPLYAVLVALLKNGEPIIAAQYYPALDEMYCAYKGGGAFWNEKQIHVRKKPDLDHSFGTSSGRFKPSVSHARFISQYLLSQKFTFGLNNFHCMAYDQALIASARRDWTIHQGAALWDYVSGALLLQEAGATVTNLSGKPWSIEDREMLAAHPSLHPKLLGAYQESLKEYRHYTDSKNT